MAQISTQLDDPILKYNSALLTQNVEERVKVLIETGQIPLAYLTARSHNLTEMAEFIEQEMQDNSSYDCMQIIDETERMIKNS